MTVEAGRSWYVLKDDQQIGPIAEATFREFINEGLIKKSDFIWRQGLLNWVAAEQLVEFKEDIATKLKPPPLPKNAFSTPGVAQQPVPPPLPKHFAVSNIEKSKPSAKTERNATARTPNAGTLQPLPKGSGSNGTTDDFGTSPTTERGNNSNYLAKHWRGKLSLPVSYWFNGFLGYLIATIAITAIGASSLLRTEFSPSIALLSMIGVWTTTLAILCWQVVGT